MNKNLGPYKYGDIVTAMRMVVDYLWENCEEACRVCSRRDMEFEEFPGKDEYIAMDHLYDYVRVLKWLVNQSYANRNSFQSRGHCPDCGGNDGKFSVDREWFCYCKLCRCMWKLDQKLTMTWPMEPCGTQSVNGKQFNSWDLVEPVLDWSKRDEGKQ